MSRKKIINKKMQRTIANRRINKLFFLADGAALSGEFNLSRRYIELARKISMRNLTPIPKKFKRRFCKNCYNYLLPNETCRIRIHRGKIIIFCHNCKKYIRIPLNTNG